MKSFTVLLCALSLLVASMKAQCWDQIFLPFQLSQVYMPPSDFADSVYCFRRCGPEPFQRSYTWKIDHPSQYSGVRVGVDGPVPELVWIGVRSMCDSLIWDTCAYAGFYDDPGGPVVFYTNFPTSINTITVCSNTTNRIQFGYSDIVGVWHPRRVGQIILMDTLCATPLAVDDFGEPGFTGKMVRAVSILGTPVSEGYKGLVVCQYRTRDNRSLWRKEWWD